MAASIGRKFVGRSLALTLNNSVVNKLVGSHSRCLAAHLCRLSSTFSTGQQSSFVNKFSTSPAVQYAEDEEDHTSTEIVEKVNDQLTCNNPGRLFAVVHIDGKQRKVTTDDIIVLQKHTEADVGETIRINKVMLVGAQDFTLIGRPILNANLVNVEAMVIEKTLGHPQISFWYKRRQNYRKFYLNKAMLTHLRISKIEVSSLQGHS